MMWFLAVLSGAAVVGGGILAGVGLVSSSPIHKASTGVYPHLWITRVNRSMTTGGRTTYQRLAVGLGLGVAAWLVTGLPLMLLVVPAALVGLPMLLSQQPNSEVELLQALDRWVRSLMATLPTGKSITDAIRVSVRQAPAMLAPRLSLLVTRLDERWTVRQALTAFADELGSADADAVVAALILSAQRGGIGATATLTALADSLQDRLRALREIETERAKPRIVVKQITIITLCVLAGAMVFGREFFAPYATPSGQIILAALLAVYVGSLAVLRRMTLNRRRGRLLGGAAQ